MNRFGDLQMFQAIAVYVIVFLIVILILRELWCWYLKLNKMVSLLTEIRDYLKAGTVELSRIVDDSWNDARKISHSRRIGVSDQSQNKRPNEWTCECGTLNSLTAPPYGKCKKCGKPRGSMVKENKSEGASLDAAL